MTETTHTEVTGINKPSIWQEFWSKEDWWAVWLGLGIVALAYVLYLTGSSISWIAVAPAKWSTLSQLSTQFSKNGIKYLALLAAFLGLFTIVISFIGQKPKAFIPSFIFIFVLSTVIYAIGSWDQANRYNLEPPLLALALGLFISNVIGLPRWLDAGFRVEFYIKLGIVLLGATLPFTLIIWAGPVAILQASIVSLVTFFVIFFTARKLGLDHRLAAVLGAGGAVCGVSASIAVAGAVRAKKEHPPIAISLVVFYAIILIFALPLVSRAIHLPTGVAGAWIGTSEFADAAGLAAAQSYGGLAGTHLGISGTAEQALASYTLIKVIGRDIWIGIWSLVLALISVTVWERTETNSKVQVGQIWWRFPKFVIGFLIASVVTTLIVHGNTLTDYNKLVKPSLILPITALRTWVFTFSFLSIGLTTRFRELAAAGIKPFAAFTFGVVVNVALGYFLSVIVFGHYWSSIVTH
ncbi:putative integral membrane protein (TIGR00698 family) [Mucilaginibacter frigoritolerans]|uniref:Putative integral membrane protein (TIGR00698 family) n=1 Tax=Mucilaginibacter frigoritolerans TaxID=652788 RepID=A0A562TR72_9SPHI|nr:putative sulfate exporter family transporter [Mucilaginibacter frigoritolerans]TWI95280.1 putative integral membrane protein (TIGR00698 family) [Mucilaginibacter frigoritolerans]